MSSAHPSILLLDDRGLFPNWKSEKVNVDCIEIDIVASLKAGLDVSSYDAIFFHVRGVDLSGWILKRVEPSKAFQISGDTTSASRQKMGYMLISRDAWKTHFAQYVSSLENGAVPAEQAERIFQGMYSEAAVQGAAHLRIVHLDGEKEDVPIARDTNGVLIADEVLDHINGSYPFSKVELPIQFSDSRPFEGAELLLDLRLRAHLDCSRCSVECVDWPDTDTIFEASLNYIVLRSYARSDGELSKEEHAELLKKLQFDEPPGRHKLANLWGPFRLWHGWRLNAGQIGLGGPDWPFEIQERLRASRFHGRLIALSGLYATEEKAAESREFIIRWRQFIEQEHQDLPLRILLLDDEAGSGWTQALEALLDGINGKCQVHSPTIPTEIAQEWVREQLRESKPDVVLCDLRLLEEEDSENTRETDYSGIQLLRQIKTERLDLPVIVFSASNKAWSSIRSADEGADGYWVKEDPTLGIDDSYSRENAADLARQIMDSVQRRRNARAVFLLCELLQTLAENEGLVSERAILEALHGKALRSYWHLVHTESQHDKDFGIQHFNLAFLELWSMVNEFDALFYQLPTPERVADSKELKLFNCRVRRPSHFSWKVYIKAVSHDSGEWKKGEVAYPSKKIKGAILPRDYDSGKLSLRDVANGMNQSHRTEWLLELEECDTGLYNKTRTLRNQLPLEHGTEASKQDATLIDIQRLASLWSDFLEPLTDV